MQFVTRLGAFAVAGACLLVAARSNAAEIWSVQEGHTSLKFNTELLGEFGFSLTGVEETATVDASAASLEGPLWHFRMTPASDLSFEVEQGTYRSNGPLTGHLSHLGGFALREQATGRLFTFRDFEIVPTTRETALGPTTAFRLGEIGSEPLLDLIYGGIVYQRNEETMRVVGFDLRINAEFARLLGRPELDGQFIGVGELVADVDWTGGAYAGENPGANASGSCDFRDVKLGILDDMSYVNRIGTYPTGVVGLAMATTSCNVGNCDVEWEAAMDEDHPGIAMHLYRETNGVLEQIGVSDIKHGFFALSSSQCTPCQNPSNGSFLGVGCSDTYGVGNNSDRNWLAPRGEWEAFPGTWECTGSHFSGDQADCVRRHGGSGHDGVQHRLQTTDAELDIAGNYFFEAYYVVRGDQNKINNYGWRPCTFTRSGNSYNFNDGSGYPVNEGPLLLTWGDTHSWGAFSGEGQVLLASKVIDLGGGNWAYEYAVLNFDSDLNVSSVTVPVGLASIASIGFNDPNLNELDSWDATVASGEIAWTTTDNVIRYGQMYNFRFISDIEPTDGRIEIANPGGQVMALQGRVPGSDPASVGDLAASSRLQLRSTPNPLTTTTAISFQLAEATEVSLDVFDTSGRLVHSLVRGVLPAGPHVIDWDATATTGETVSSGVYYARIQAGTAKDVRALRVLR